MYRVDDTTAVAQIPAEPTDNIGTPGFFTGGSTSGQAPTRVRYSWLNRVQEELMAFLTQAGIAPVKGVNNQVLASAQALFTGVNALKPRGTPGYTKLPSGVIIQSFPTPAVNLTQANTAISYNYTFPQPFPTTCSGIWGSDGGTAGTTWGSFTTSATGGVGYVWSLSASGSVQGHITAIGY